jgi:hypothetical protein
MTDEEKEKQTALHTWIACMVKELVEGFLVDLLYYIVEESSWHHTAESGTIKDKSSTYSR